MEELFCSYSQAKELKELRIDIPCLAYYNENKKFILLGLTSCQEEFKNSDSRWIDGDITAPLKQQVFSWAYSKHDLLCSIIPESTSRYKLLERTFNIVIYRFSMNLNVQTEICRIDGTIARYMNYEQAESECINKLISILKEKQ